MTTWFDYTVVGETNDSCKELLIKKNNNRIYLNGSVKPTETYKQAVCTRVWEDCGIHPSFIVRCLEYQDKVAIITSNIDDIYIDETVFGQPIWIDYQIEPNIKNEWSPTLHEIDTIVNAAKLDVMSMRLSYLLRAIAPRLEKLGKCTLWDDGSVDIDSVLLFLQYLSFDDLDKIVNRSSKKRYQFCHNNRIVALSGFTAAFKEYCSNIVFGIQIKLEDNPPLYVYHETTSATKDLILTSSLSRMLRTHVHATTKKRHIVPENSRVLSSRVGIEINLHGILKETSIKVFRTAEDVYLFDDDIPIQFLKIIPFEVMCKLLEN